MTGKGLEKTAVSLFCGCGGMDLGAKLAGFNIIAAFDNNPDSINSYNLNLKDKATLTELNTLDINLLPINPDLLLGGPPCQGFSTAGSKRNDDPRNLLWKVYLKILRTIRPKVFVLENVPRFLKQAYPSFLESLNQIIPNGYSCDTKIVNMQFYGVPQRRRRSFIVGIRKDCLLLPPWPKAKAREFASERRQHSCLISMQKTLQDLGPAQPVDDKKTSSKNLDHVYLPFENKHYMICKHIPNGGSLKDIPGNSLPKPYKGRNRKGDPGWLWYYRKPLPDLPGRTVLASLGPTYAQIQAPDVWVEQDKGKWIWHPISPKEYIDSKNLYTSPVEPRRLTVRECARLQTFPDNFLFIGDILSRYRQVGNAVPVEFARQLCSAIRDTLDGVYDYESNSQIKMEF